jgi:hypothetical protein
MHREKRQFKLTIDKDGNIDGDTAALFTIYQIQNELGIKMKDIPLCG